ncbi:hypothetical protein TIFTF001_036319 [Ficus carica]|uniref:Uncharacterized protein n=1 Tax=Ficus carica TaxID=3494 RepID=A0AA88EDD0_FICCA|nr:hypothetical protein TIFTF001_036319 [Ficus carica]
MSIETWPENVPWPGILAKNVGEAIDHFFNDEETWSKVTPRWSCPSCSSLSQNVTTSGDHVNMSDDQTTYVKALHARLDRLEREVREYKTLYEKKSKESAANLNRLENVLERFGNYFRYSECVALDCSFV